MRHLAAADSAADGRPPNMNRNRSVDTAKDTFPGTTLPVSMNKKRNTIGTRIKKSCPHLDGKAGFVRKLLFHFPEPHTRTV